MDDIAQRADVVTGGSAFEGLPADVVDAVLGTARRRVLHAGEVLFRAGEPADGMAVVDRGRLGVVDADDQVIATMGRGDVVGEMGALTGATRTSTVIALRDTSVLDVDQAAFDHLFDTNPVVGRALSRLVVERLTGDRRPGSEGTIPTTVAVVTVGGADRNSREIERLVAALTARVGSSAVLRDEPGLVDRSPAELMAILETTEADNDLLVLLGGDARDAVLAGPGRDTDWFDRSLRQADAVVVVVTDPDGDDDVAVRLGARLAALRTVVELAVVDPAHAEVGRDAARWIERLRPHRLHHVRAGDDQTARRCARLVLGQGTGLVFSGGAAKGLAHLGAWRALCELGVEIDTVAGVSFGALMAAGVALGYDPDQLQGEVHDRLVTERGLVDVTFPWMALLRGQGVSRRIEDVARGRRFEQTWRSFVCTSCDLTTGETVEHRSGMIWEAIRASVSIPGVLPPVRVGDRLLVDGAVRNNLPVAALRAGHPTPLHVIAVDVGKNGVLPPGETPDAGAVSGWRLVGRRIDPRRPTPGVPSMPQVLMRVMDLAGATEATTADQVIRPDLRDLGVGDFEQIDDFARAGYDATIAALR